MAAEKSASTAESERGDIDDRKPGDGVSAAPPIIGDGGDGEADGEPVGDGDVVPKIAAARNPTTLPLPRRLFLSTVRIRPFY